MEPVMITLEEDVVPASVESALRATGATVLRTYSLLGLIAVEADTAQVRALRRVDGVLAVDRDWPAAA